MAPGHQVQADAQVLQVLLAAPGMHALLAGQEAVPFEVGPGLAVTGRIRRPEDCLKVAQAAWRFLDAGFQAVRRVVVTQVPFLLLEPLAFEENERVEVAAQPLREGGEQVLVAGQ